MRSLPLYMLALVVLALGGCRTDERRAASEAAVVTPAPAPAVDQGQPPRPTVAVEVRPTPAEQELIGKAVRVSLRRDALGLAASSTPEPDANMIAGKQVVLSGVVERFGDGWLVLKGSGGKRYWIAASGILLIEEVGESNH